MKIIIVNILISIFFLMFLKEYFLYWKLSAVTEHHTSLKDYSSLLTIGGGTVERTFTGGLSVSSPLVLSREVKRSTVQPMVYSVVHFDLLLRDYLTADVLPPIDIPVVFDVFSNVPFSTVDQSIPDAGVLGKSAIDFSKIRWNITASIPRDRHRLRLAVVFMVSLASRKSMMDFAHFLSRMAKSEVLACASFFSPYEQPTD